MRLSDTSAEGDGHGLRRPPHEEGRCADGFAYLITDSPYSTAAGYTPPQLDAPAAPSLTMSVARAGDTIEADVCVIGSGAGGGVVAAELARAGKHVVVLERAAPRLEPDFDGRELAGY